MKAEAKVRIQSGLITYCKLMEMFQKVDVSKDADFQRIYDGFYRVRRNASWRKVYFDYFQSVKNSNVTFKDIITHMYEEKGTIEASFSSKMLATINPDIPIWDQYVLKKLGIEQKYYYSNKDQQLKDAIENYDKIVEWYKNKVTEDYIKEFDDNFPNYKQISSTKKVDWLLWGIRDEDDIESSKEDVTALIDKEIKNIKYIVDNNEMSDGEISATIEALEDLIKYIS